LQQEGKTDQAKADLARLAQIRKQREEAAAARKAADEGEQMREYPVCWLPDTVVRSQSCRSRRQAKVMN